MIGGLCGGLEGSRGYVFGLVAVLAGDQLRFPRMVEDWRAVKSTVGGRIEGLWGGRRTRERAVLKEAG